MNKTNMNRNEVLEEVRARQKQENKENDWKRLYDITFKRKKMFKNWKKITYER
jgi:hypothetical protein